MRHRRVLVALVPVAAVAAGQQPNLGGNCELKGRLIFCRKHVVLPAVEEVKAAPTQKRRIIIDIAVKEKALAAKLLSGNWHPLLGEEPQQEQLTLLGPVSQASFNDAGDRDTEVALTDLGHWSRWLLREREARHCGEGGVTWTMAVVLANLLGSAVPEFPRLRVLETGAGTGLVSLTLAGRGHYVVATDGSKCVLANLRANIDRATSPGEIRPQFMRWHVAKERERVAALGPFDLIVGADLLYDSSNCDSIRLVLRHLLSSSAAAVFAERDLASQASRCAATLRSDGWHVEELPGFTGMTAAVVNGHTNPRPVRVGGASPLVLRVTKH